MIDELVNFSKQVSFDLILLREYDAFYNASIDLLKSNDVKIYIQPRSMRGFAKKLLISFKLLLSNFSWLKFNYNTVIVFKSIWYFLWLDVSKFSDISNIHAQFATQASLVSLLIKKYYKNSPRYSFTYHAYDIYFENKWLHILVHNCFKCFSISKYNTSYLKERYLIDSPKVVLSRLGVEPPIEANSPQVKADKKKLTLGLMSWFVEKKGIIYLLQAMRTLKEQEYHSIKLILAGDGPLKYELLAFIDENDLKDCVQYIGVLDDKSKDDFFRSIDTFVLPCISLKNDQDGIPVVLMEAISFGLPIISTRVSGVPEICINEYNGFLIEERDSQALVASILKLLKNYDLRIEFSQNALKKSKDYNIYENSKAKLKQLCW